MAEKPSIGVKRTTKQLCKNCKHLETDGMFGIFCGVGGDNTKYNCSKYEQKEVIGMTAKRFTFDEDVNEDYMYELGVFSDNGEVMETTDVLNCLNELSEENEQLKQQLQKIQNSFEASWTRNYLEFNKDKLYIRDNHTIILLNDTNLYIDVYIPEIDEYYRFEYRVSGRGLMKEFVENYGDLEMTEKRFTCEDCEKLNNLHEENQDLQSRIDDYDVALKRLQDLTEKKLKENEQLKQQLQSILKLTKKIEDYTYDMKLIGDLE